MTSSLPRAFILGSVFVYSRSRLIFNLFEPERVPNPEDSERENEQVNDRLEGTFWCSCERCQIITTQRECVCCREQSNEENKLTALSLPQYPNMQLIPLELVKSNRDSVRKAREAYLIERGQTLEPHSNDQSKQVVSLFFVMVFSKRNRNHVLCVSIKI